jgi:hypothetical protein
MKHKKKIVNNIFYKSTTWDGFDFFCIKIQKANQNCRVKLKKKILEINFGMEKKERRTEDKQKFYFTFKYETPLLWPFIFDF